MMKERRHIKLRFVCSLVIAFFLSSCSFSTVMKLDTVPSGASVTIDGNYIGKSPIQVKLANKTFIKYVVKIEKKGYKTLVKPLPHDTKTNQVIWGYFCLVPFLWVDGVPEYFVYELKKPGDES